MFDWCHSPQYFSCIGTEMWGVTDSLLTSNSLIDVTVSSISVVSVLCGVTDSVFQLYRYWDVRGYWLSISVVSVLRCAGLLTQYFSCIGTEMCGVTDSVFQLYRYWDVRGYWLSISVVSVLRCAGLLTRYFRCIGTEMCGVTDSVFQMYRYWDVRGYWLSISVVSVLRCAGLLTRYFRCIGTEMCGVTDITFLGGRAGSKFCHLWNLLPLEACVFHKHILFCRTWTKTENCMYNSLNGTNDLKCPT